MSGFVLKSIDVKTQLINLIDELEETDLPKGFFKEHLFIAGGSIRSLVNNEVPKDYDIFCRTPEGLEKLKEILKDIQKYSSLNAIGHTSLTGKDIQFILCEIGSPEKIIGEFDFMMNMNYYDPKEDNLVIHYAAYDKKLRVNSKARNVLGTLARISKFVARGYECPDATDLVTLGIRASKMEPVVKTSQLVQHCRLASCISSTVIFNNDLEEDYDISSLEITLRGSGA